MKRATYEDVVPDIGGGRHEGVPILPDAHFSVPPIELGRLWADAPPQP